jgi:hypothetical protein
MAFVVTLAIVIFLVALRLTLPPVPGMLQMGFARWGRRNTILLCATALAGAAVLIVISR